LTKSQTKLDIQYDTIPTPETYCCYFDNDSFSLTTNTIALVGIKLHPMIVKKLYQKSENPWLNKLAASVSGIGLNVWLITASLLKLCRIAFAVQLLTIGTMWC